MDFEDPILVDAEGGSLAPVGSYPTSREAHERGLVALSMGLPYWVFSGAGGFDLLVETHRLPTIAPEVAAYDREAAAWQRDLEAEGAHRPGDYQPGFILPCLYAIVLAGVFLFQQHEGRWVIEVFGNDSEAVFRFGEWWRPATALFLHSDLPHLLGNIGFGLWFGVLVARALGSWLGWGLILLNGILANLLTAWIYYPAHTISIGASTAVFGALGILAGGALHHSLRNHHLGGVFARLAPFAAGLALLGLLGAGTSDARTDIVGHVCGFGCGLIAGSAVVWIKSRRR